MGQLLAPIGKQAVHLCIDMQRLFEPGKPWATPWLERVLPQVTALAAHGPQRSIFTRFIPVRSKEEARGVWKAYYGKWECVTREKIDPTLLELVPRLARYVPPAAIIDRQTYCAFRNGRLQAYLDQHHVDTLIVSGGETDVCVLATVLAAVDYGYRVILAQDALCSSSDESHDALLDLYTKRFSLQIEVASAESILENWAIGD
ncbi:cysteine hydrolase family protein [Bradyrhizobium sp. CCGUVB23]|uniref:cysteine hydrolase family protein n=1 Tax=Bradyrhizobium sp. CCGUVB23 TaxID=2949630 RepID=UPI0020B1C5F2|nr:isochorismatase family cysteine hydrolase [Bradyrhizobium sp. CCGUVB23]MCP3459664.1 cysteine hydrolase [Bradyrhizobium sp. CCGUVB23]